MEVQEAIILARESHRRGDQRVQNMLANMTQNRGNRDSLEDE
jgi:hypothetical protein